MLIDHLRHELADKLAQQMQALYLAAPLINAAEGIEKHLREAGIEASAVGQVESTHTSVHVIANADPCRISQALVEHDITFERGLPRNNGLVHPFAVKFSGVDVSILALHQTFEKVAA